MGASLRTMMDSHDDIVSCPECEAPIARVVLDDNDPALQVPAPDDAVGCTGEPLHGEYLAHYNNHRYSCPSCSAVFCASCTEMPYHCGFTCAEYLDDARNRECRYCAKSLVSPHPGSTGNGSTDAMASPVYVEDFTSVSFDGYHAFGDAGTFPTAPELFPTDSLTLEAWVCPSKKQVAEGGGRGMIVGQGGLVEARVPGYVTKKN